MKPCLFASAAAAAWLVAFTLASEPSPAGKQITELRREIARHDELYHRQAAPEISDAEYDALKRRLAALERAHPDAAESAPSLAEIGDDRSGLFQTYRHRERMLSLEKAYNEADVRAFHARLVKLTGTREIEYVVEPKYDGLAVSVTFEKGKLVRAVTRGNGSEGDDITANALQLRGLPRELRGTSVPDVIEVRGEIYVSFTEFERINAERDAAGQTRFANPRNLAAGTLRQIDAAEVSRREADIVFYGVGACEPASALPPTQQGLHALLAEWGLPSLKQTWRARGADELVRAIDAVNRAREGFGFPTDGAVVKLDALALQREAGASEHAPRWALAYKFAPERAETQVLAITLQVGRTGVITPVAELAAVNLGGSTVARATLHNREEIARKDVRVGDFVFVEKAGEIIPAIVGVNLAKRPPSAQPFVWPSACPDCRTALALREGEVAVRCTNPGCAAQLRRRLEHFASKGCVDLEGLGPAMIESLVAKGAVKDIADLYRLRRADLLTPGRSSTKSADRLLAALEASRRAELWRVIHGLGVPQVGVVGAKELARKFGTLEALAAADERFTEAAQALLAAGVQPSGPGKPGVRLAGKTFVLTGALPTLSRAEATARIEAAGGKIGGGVTRATTYVVAGSEPGTKLEQARKLGVVVIGEPELLRLLADERRGDGGSERNSLCGFSRGGH